MECDLGDIAISYETYGAGRPIVMVPGRPSDHRVMMRFHGRSTEGVPSLPLGREHLRAVGFEIVESFERDPHEGFEIATRRASICARKPVRTS
jgi:hypothetical protein